MFTFTLTVMANILITRFPYESVLSGEEWHTITLTQKLQERGHAVFFMGSCQVFLETLPKEGVTAYAEPGGPVPVSGTLLIKFLCTFPYYALRWAWRLRKIQKKHHIDAVYMHSLSEKILLTPFARLFGLRVVWVEHQRWGRWMLQNPLRHIYRLWARHVHIIGVSPLYRDGFKRLHLPEMRTHIITNGIDLSVFHPDVTPLPLGENALHIGCVARLSVDKGVDILLDAFLTLCERAQSEHWTTPDLHLHLIGEGPLRDQLATQTQHSPYKDRVHMYVPYRTIPRQDTPRFMKALDIFVLPSALPDPFGLVAAESMAVGTPTIVTDVSGIRYQLSPEKDSVMINAGNTVALVDALSTLVQTPEKRASIAAASRITAEKEFSLDTMVDRYLTLLLTPEK